MTSDRFKSLIQKLQNFAKNPATQKSMPTVLVAGDVCMDRFVFGSVDRISPEAPVPVLFEERIDDRLGCMANVAVNLAALATAMPITQKVFGVVGDDEIGRKILKDLGSESLGSLISRIESDPLRPTTLKTRYLAGSHHQLLRVDRENTAGLSPKIQKNILDQMAKDLPSAKLLLLQDYAKGFFSGGFLQQIKELARQHKIPVILDPNRNTPAEFYRSVKLITPNVAEAEALLDGKISLAKGADSAAVEKACRELKKRLDLEMCLITRSAHGMTLLDQDDQIFHFPSVARSVFDVTGAGDTVIAVLAAGLAHDFSPEESCWMASAAASVVVAKVGTATATIAEIIPELQRISELNH